MWFQLGIQDSGLRKCIGMSTNLHIHASINSLVTYKLKGLGTFCLDIFWFRIDRQLFLY